MLDQDGVDKTRCQRQWCLPKKRVQVISGIGIMNDLDYAQSPNSVERKASIEIRSLRPEDNQAVKILILGILNYEFSMSFKLEELPDLIDVHDTYIASGNGQFWVATRESKVVGCIGLLQLSGAELELRRMYVDSCQRGNGIAQRLLDHVMAWCATRDVSNLYLETNEQWKSAHYIYEKYGFEPVSREVLPETFPVVRVATGFYRLRLAK